MAFSPVASADTFAVFGPQTFVRGKGQPTPITASFTILDPTTTYTLRIENAGVTDAAVTLNKVQVVGPGDFNSKGAVITKPVTLKLTNQLSVELRGNEGESFSLQIIGVDNVPPSITAAVTPAPNAAGWNRTDTTITFTCADTISGVASCTSPVTVTTETAGQTVVGTAVDKAGNTATTSVTVELDKTPPSLAITSPAAGAQVFSSPITVTGTAADTLSGLANVTCNGAPATVNGTTFSCSVTLVQGTNSITVLATDISGNTSTRSVTVNLGAAAPSITDFNPKTGAIGTLVNVTGSNFAQGSIAPRVELNKQGGGTILAPLSNFTSTSIAFVIPDGAATGPLTVTAGGQSVTSATSLTVVVPSAGTFVAFGPQTFVRGKGQPNPIAASFTILDPTTTYTLRIENAGVTSAAVTLNKVQVVGPGDFNSKGAVITKPVTLKLTNELSVELGGNEGESFSLQIIGVDNIPPSITAAVTPAPNAAGWNRTDTTITFTCADTTSGIASCTAPITVTTETAGQPVVGIATDKAGHNAFASVVVKLDRTSPSLAVTSPATGAKVFASLITVTGTVADALSGLASVTCNGAPAAVNGISFSCGVTLVPGSNSTNVMATDVAGDTSTSTLSLTYAPVPTVSFTAPANLSFLNLSPTTVTGTVDDPTATVTVNSISAPVANGRFSVTLPLAEGPNTVTATATSGAGAVGNTSIEVTLDTTPPHVTITSPPDKFVTTDASITVAGNVNDIVVGTVNDQQAQVTVNGTSAQVANRMFLATNVPLNMGSNVIQAVGRDRVGNAATTQIMVERQAPTPSEIRLISGNNQTGMIGSVLPAPLVVAVTDSAGNPFPNKPVIFKVMQDDGMVSSGGPLAATVIATTNGQGQAQAQWKLGMRAGAGGDSVEAYVVGVNGTAIFTATGTQGPAGKIVIDTGNNQIGEVNQALPKPLIGVVVDNGNNRLAGVPVTFTVKEGGGSFGGQPTFTVNTDSDGRVAATLTLGLQEGNANNLVEANFPSNTSFPASFTASGRAPGDASQTTISGVVLDNSNVPIPGVTIRAVLTHVMNANSNFIQSVASIQTNAQGQFTIPQAPVGFVKLLVDGSTAQRPGKYPTLDYDLVTVAGQNNTLSQPIYLLALNANNQLCVTATTGGGTLTIPEAPGFSLTFGPGQVTFPGGSKEGCVNVTVVHGDKVPMVPGFGQQPRFIVTIQPAGAIFNPPAAITLPNVDGLRARAVTEMYSFDHDIGSFVAIGTGTVSDDGQVIRSSPGVGVLKAGWHCGGNPNQTGTAATCPECKKCQGDSCVNDNGATCDDGKFCTSADGKNPGSDKCSSGTCRGKEIEAEVMLKVEVDPVKIIKIKKVIEDVSDLASTVTKWMPCWVGKVTPDVSLSEEKGKFCCEQDKKILDGNRVSGGGGASVSASCFVGLSSLAPELPPSIIEAIGLEGKASVGVKVSLADVLDTCSGPQWNEKGDLSVSLNVDAVVVKVGDIIGAKLKGPNGTAKVGFTGQNLFDDLHFTGSACIDGEVSLEIVHFGQTLEIKLFSLFNKACFGG